MKVSVRIEVIRWKESIIFMSTRLPWNVYNKPLCNPISYLTGAQGFKSGKKWQKSHYQLPGDWGEEEQGGGWWDVLGSELWLMIIPDNNGDWAILYIAVLSHCALCVTACFVSLCVLIHCGVHFIDGAVHLRGLFFCVYIHTLPIPAPIFRS